MPDKSNYNEAIQRETLKMSGDGGKSSESSSTKGAYSGRSSTSLDATDTKQNKNIDNTVANANNSTLKKSVGNNFGSEYQKVSEQWNQAGGIDVVQIQDDAPGEGWDTWQQRHAGSSKGLEEKYGYSMTREEVKQHRKDGTAMYQGEGAVPESGLHRSGGSIIDTRQQNRSIIYKPTTSGQKQNAARSMPIIDAKPISTNTTSPTLQTRVNNEIKSNLPTKKERKQEQKGIRKAENQNKKRIKSAKKDAYNVEKKQYKKKLKSEIKKYKSISSLKPYARSIAKSKVSKPTRR